MDETTAAIVNCQRDVRDLVRELQAIVGQGGQIQSLNAKIGALTDRLDKLEAKCSSTAIPE